MKPHTTQEEKVLDLDRQGRASDKISEAQLLSRCTVENQWKNLLLKFNAKNAAELVKKAIYLNDLRPDRDKKIAQ